MSTTIKPEVSNGDLGVAFEDTALHDQLMPILQSILPSVSLHYTEFATLMTKPTHPVVVVLRAPEESLALALETSEDISAAVTSWADWHQTLVVGQRKARRHITLVDAAMLSEGSIDDVARTLLAERLNLTIDWPATFSALTLEAGSLARLSAMAILATNHRVTTIATDIESAIVGARPSRTAIEHASAALIELRQLAAQHSDDDINLSAAYNEISVLREQLGVTVAAEAAAQQQMHEFRIRASDAIIFDAANRQLAARIDEVEELGRLKLEILGALSLADATALRFARIEALRDKSSRFEAKLFKIFGSKSWQVTNILGTIRRHLRKEPD